MNDRKTLEDIVGKEHVFDSKEILTEFSKDESFVNPVMPRYVVKVHSTSNVQALVKWANETGTPLIPVSSGPPHYRGSRRSRLPGQRG